MQNDVIWKIYLRDFAAGVYLSEAQNPISPLSPLDTVYVYTIYYSISHREGGQGKRVEPERRLEGQQFRKLGRKYLRYWLYLQSKLW